MIHYIDQIYGSIEFPAYVFEIVDTIEFQRLRNVKQLGVTHYVFPGGTHTRFEHCIGVCHLVEVLLDRLEKNNKISIDPFHRKCVKLAGLLHDVGHGPFSHMWEQFVHHGKDKNWNHEDTSCDVTRHIIDKNRIKLSTDAQKHLDGIEMIVAFIRGDYNTLEKYLTKEHMYLAEIVNNKFCFIDVDKWDYILRDAYYLNHAISIKKTFEQCFQGARVTKDLQGTSHISYDYRHYRHIYDLFENRSNLHKYCYQNPDIVGIEELLLAAFQLAENSGFLFKGVRLSEAHNHIDIYKYLDDTILQQIEISDNPALAQAQSQIERIKTRKLYKVVFQSANPIPIPCDNSDTFIRKSRIIKSAEEAIPKSVLFHDEDGEIVNRINYTFEPHILYSMDPNYLKPTEQHNSLQNGI